MELPISPKTSSSGHFTPITSTSSQRWPVKNSSPYPETKFTFARRLRQLLIALSVCALLLAGCHRSYYRRQADKEAQRLIQQKSNDPRWNSSSDGTIEVSPQSRMFDPFSLDHPPIPPDDPASHSLMFCVDGKRGYPHWHANGDTSHVENPEWRAYLPINESGEVQLDLHTAYQMALLHSPDLQTQREILYLSALDVSLERFGFDSQLFAGYNSFFSVNGSDRGEGTFLTSDFGDNSQGFNFSKMGITGATFAAGLANSILWNFSGADTQAATSLIDFSIIQPLLRNAGRSRILESLTQSERNLLANVRQLDRFRRGFYLNIVTGRGAGAGPGTNFLASPGGIGGVGGYIGLLQQQQQIRIQEFNVRQLENVLEQFREFFRRERINSLQVRQFEGTLYSAQDTLLTLKTNYQTALDNFKEDLGLPPDLEININDELLDRFEFISDEVTNRQIEINLLRSETGEVLNLIDEDSPAGIEAIEDENFSWSDELPSKVVQLVPFFDRANKLIEELASADREQIEQDLEKLEEIRDDRIEYLAELRTAIDRGEILADVEPAILQPDSILSSDTLESQLVVVLRDLERVKTNLNGIRERVENFDSLFKELNKKELYDLIGETIGTDISEQLTQLYKVSLEMSLIQAKARGNSIGLNDVDLDDDTAFRIAKCFRRDLMNARAALVDQWREIEFVADQLESEVDLVFEAEIGNNGNSPFSLRTANGEIRGGFRFDAPIVRLSERNDYRQSLISYQQARRNFYQFRDTIHANLRQVLRELDLNKILFELNRQNVQVAIEQVELAQLSLEDPSSTSLGATTARDLTQAISALQSAQSQFLAVWVDFEVLRRSLDFDLGTFQFGPDFDWIDPEVIDETIAPRAAALMGIDLESQCYCDIYGEEGGTGDSEFVWSADSNGSIEPDEAAPADPNTTMELETDISTEQLGQPRVPEQKTQSRSARATRRQSIARLLQKTVNLVLRHPLFALAKTGTNNRLPSSF